MDASRRCQERKWINTNQFEAPIVPAIVCLGFATELYLKAVLACEGNLIKVHSLKELFNALSKDKAEMIRNNLKLTDLIFDSKISEVNDVFIDWRYIYESGNKAINLGFLNGLINELRKIIEVESKQNAAK